MSIAQIESRKEILANLIYKTIDSMNKISHNNDLKPDAKERQKQKLLDDFKNESVGNLERLRDLYQELKRESQLAEISEKQALKNPTMLDYEQKRDWLKAISLLHDNDIVQEYEKALDLNNPQLLFYCETELPTFLMQRDRNIANHVRAKIEKVQQDRVTDSTKQNIQYLKDDAPIIRTTDRMLTELSQSSYLSGNVLYVFLSLLGKEAQAMQLNQFG